MAPDFQFEIREKHYGYDVIDLERGKWRASFRMFADAQKFAEEQVAALKTALGNDQ